MSVELPILIVEDEWTDRLWPITATRPAWDILTGGYTLRGLLRTTGRRIHLHPRQFLRDTVCLDDPCDPLVDGDATDPCILINARLLPRIELIEWIQGMDTGTTPEVLLDEEILALALVPRGLKWECLTNLAAWRSWFPSSRGPRIDTQAARGWLAKYPHEIVMHNLSQLTTSLDWRIRQGGVSERAPGVYVESDVMLQDPMVLDGSQGPILLERGTQVAPFSVLRGPLWIGRDCRINAHSEVKNGCSLGPVCRVGGELESTIVASYSNKQHFGYVGHSYLGSWVNLGAGTTTSNLKHTYGEIQVDYGEGRVLTGTTLLGIVMGDYSRSSILTSIYTGKLIGVGSFLYGTVAEHVPDFVNYAKSLGAITQVDLPVILQTQGRMFGRRGLIPSVHQQELLRRVHARSASHRQGLPVSQVRF